MSRGALKKMEQWLKANPTNKVVGLKWSKATNCFWCNLEQAHEKPYGSGDTLESAILAALDKAKEGK